MNVVRIVRLKNWNLKTNVKSLWTTHQFWSIISLYNRYSNSFVPQKAAWEQQNWCKTNDLYDKWVDAHKCAWMENEV